MCQWVTCLGLRGFGSNEFATDSLVALTAKISQVIEHWRILLLGIGLSQRSIWPSRIV